jgi:hypothetical protein
MIIPGSFSVQWITYGATKPRDRQQETVQFVYLHLEQPFLNCSCTFLGTTAKMARRLASREDVAVASVLPLGFAVPFAPIRHPVDVLPCFLRSPAAEPLGAEHPIGATAAAGRFRLAFVAGLLQKLLALLFAFAFGATSLIKQPIALQRLLDYAPRPHRLAVEHSEPLPYVP